MNRLASPFTALAIAVAALAAPLASVQAAVVSYTFTVQPEATGGLAGTGPALGSFSFDDAQAPVIGFGGERLHALTAFGFSLNGTSYGLGDLSFGDATFEDNGTGSFVFVGLDAGATGLFSLVSGLGGFDPYFAYELPNLDPGFGSVAYQLDGGQVPEPASAWLALLALAPLAGAARRRARNRHVQGQGFTS